MNRYDRALFGPIFAIGLLFSVSLEVYAQQKHNISLDMSVAQTKYTYQHVLDVGDMPGHQIRLYEIERTFASNPPMIKGVRIAQVWNRGQSEMTNGNGRSWGYSIFLLENGDCIIEQYSGTLITEQGADGHKRTRYSGAGTVVSGTGSMRGITGTSLGLAEVTMKDGAVQSNHTRSDIEYWFE